MKLAPWFFLIAQSFFICPVLNAQTARVAPVSMPLVSASVAVGTSMNWTGAGAIGLGSQSLSAGRLKLSPPMSGASVHVAEAPVVAAPQAALPAPASLDSTLPAARPEAAGIAAKTVAGPAANESTIRSNEGSSLGSLQAAAEPRRQGQTKEAAASVLFDGTDKKSDPKEWTFMVFLNGHNSLDDYGEVNIKQMEQVGSNDRVNIVVQWASLGKPTRRMLIQRSESGEVSSPVLETLPDVDMGSADQLSEFIRWTVEHFPAQRYMIDLWNHGGGWHVSDKKGKFSPQDISWDDQTGHHITTEQLGDVMRQAKTLIGRPIDVLGFDACLMAMAEVAAQVGDSVRYAAGSEQTEPGAGWPYGKALQQWLAAGADDGAALLKALTEQYVAAYDRNVAFSGLDLAKMPALMEAVNAFGKELAKLDDASFAGVRKAAQDTQRYASSDYGDFLDFVAKLANAPVALVAAPVISAVTAACKAMVVANAATSDISGSNGMSVWLPMSPYDWQEYGDRYIGLAWNLFTKWGELAHRFSGAA
jgi:hypothetical protein